MSDYTYPDEFIRKTETRIRKQLDGNGVNPKDIKLTVKRQGVGQFSAQTHFDADVAVTQSSTRGKKTIGKLVEAGNIKAEVEGFTADLQSGETLSQTAKEQIKSLPLKGFGANKIQIPLKDKNTSFTEHTSCGRCQGKGQAQCQTCQGRGRSQCPMCHMQGYLKCIHCHGRGQVQDGDTMKHCTFCHGKGQNFCTQCHGQKEVQCATCQTRGMISCTDCNGEGANSSHTTIEPFLKISSAIHIQDMDEEPKTFAAKVTPERLAKGGHVDIEEIKPPEDEDNQKTSELSYYEDAPEIQTDNAVYYQATMPWAVAGVEVNGKPYNVSFAGKKGAVCDAGHFMDDLLDKPFTLLRDAAQGNGFVAGLLKDACAVRVSRETLSAVTTMSRKKAMAQLSKTYSVGLTKQSLHAFVQNGYLALKRVTRRPRYIGLCVGLMLSAAIYYHWFMNGARDMTSIHPDNIRMAMDSVPLVIGILLTMISIKGTGFFVFKNLMRDIGVKTNKLPAVGTAGLYGLLGNLLLWGVMFTNLFVSF